MNDNTAVEKALQDARAANLERYHQRIDQDVAAGILAADYARTREDPIGIGRYTEALAWLDGPREDHDRPAWMPGRMDNVERPEKTRP